MTPPPALSQSPSLRGSGRFDAEALLKRLRHVMSQSPSLRGSGRFNASRTNSRRWPASLNPLHCGAVVASGRPKHRRGRRRRGLNPLHCGAVVASPRRRAPQRGRRRHVSIPFIAGQWSLRRKKSRGLTPLPRLNPLHCGAVVASGEIGPRCGRGSPSQSPSLRGSGRFRPGPERRQARLWKSQSPSLRGSGRFLVAELGATADEAASQSPSLRGSGRFRAEAPQRVDERTLSIPFIAGQWSLPPARRKAGGQRRKTQSPSLRGSGRFRRGGKEKGNGNDFTQSPSLRGSGRFRIENQLETLARLRLNPLHCGAVVASTFWRTTRNSTGSTQSPSLRGSGRFLAACGGSGCGRRRPQSPSLRGSGRFRERPGTPRDQVVPLNPLHCGAVVASGAAASRTARRSARPQSPSLRGSGRFLGVPQDTTCSSQSSQSPSLRGSGRFR